MSIYKNNLSPIQVFILIIIIGVILMLSFFVVMALLPFILLIGIYFWYRARKKLSSIKTDTYIYEENEQAHSTHLKYISHSSDFSEEKKKENTTVIYDITPENYTIEESKKN